MTGAGLSAARIDATPIVFAGFYARSVFMCYHGSMNRLGLILLLPIVVMAPIGCTTVRVTDPGRTATEQFLLTESASRAVKQLTADALRGRNIFVDTTYFGSTEQPFVLGEFRAHLLEQGVLLLAKRDDAEIIVEVRTGGVGIDRYGVLLGLPTLALSGGSAAGAGGSTVPINVPEIALIKNVRQDGIAAVSYVAYWRDTGELVAASGPFVGRSLRDDWWFFGFGPRSTGDIPPVKQTE